MKSSRKYRVEGGRDRKIGVQLAFLILGFHIPGQIDLDWLNLQIYRANCTTPFYIRELSIGGF